MPAKPLTPEQRADAERLKTAFVRFQQRQKEQGLPSSQLAIAEDMPFNQSAMSQYLNGNIPLNRDALVAFCEKIQARPEDVSPSIFRDEVQASARLSTTKTTASDEGRTAGRRGAVAHAMSLEAITVPSTISWELLQKMGRSDLPAQFTVKMPDDSLTGHIEKGTGLIFERDFLPSAGKTVFIEDRDGNRFIRRYGLVRGAHWQAQSTKSVYVTLDSETDGLEVLATMRWRED